MNRSAREGSVKRYIKIYLLCAVWMTILSTYEEQSEWRIHTCMSSKVAQRRLKWFGHVRRWSLEHAYRQIMDMKARGKWERGRLRTRWRMSEDDGEEPSMTIVATPDDGRRKKDGGWQKTMARNHRWPLWRPQMTGEERKMADDRRRWQRTIGDHCGDPRWQEKKERWQMTEDDGKEPSMPIVATPDDGRRKKDGGWQKTMAKNHQWPLRLPQMTGEERKMADDRRRWQRTIDAHCGDPRWRKKEN